MAHVICRWHIGEDDYEMKEQADVSFRLYWFSSAVSSERVTKDQNRAAVRRCCVIKVGPAVLWISPGELNVISQLRFPHVDGA